MPPLLYSTLVDWYDLIDPVAEHADEASCFRDAFERAIGPRAETLLELGSGAGNNAVHLAHRFRCTLSDVAPAMLGLSRAQNPSCEHVEADMRALRLGRATWHRLLAAAGFQVEPLARPISADEHDEVFLCRRPDR